MPELPEVETTRRGISPHIVNKPIRDIVIRQHQLRWPVLPSLGDEIIGRQITEVGRRAKYLIFYLEHGCVILHLGMSGSLRILDPAVPADKHDHVDILFRDGTCLRFRDPRTGTWLADPDEQIQARRAAEARADRQTARADQQIAATAAAEARAGIAHSHRPT